MPPINQRQLTKYQQRNTWPDINFKRLMITDRRRSPWACLMMQRLSTIFVALLADAFSTALCWKKPQAQLLDRFRRILCSMGTTILLLDEERCAQMLFSGKFIFHMKLPSSLVRMWRFI